MSQTTRERNKALVLEAFDTLFNQRDYKAAERYWSPDYIQHSAHIGPGREGLFDLIKVSRARVNGNRAPLAMKIAILDDYQNVALRMADWAALAGRAEITVFNDHLADPVAIVERLAPFDVICVMRERTPLPREILQRLPKLKLIASTGARNASIDMAAAKELGIAVTATDYRSTSTIELTWALILASVRPVIRENEAVRDGRWQTSIGEELSGKILGVLGLGNIGAAVARIGLAFGMKIIAWSQNMTPDKAETAGATLVSKDELFRQADIVTIHLILSGRTRGLVGAAELALMKPTSRLINTSRGPLSMRRLWSKPCAHTC